MQAARKLVSFPELQEPWMWCTQIDGPPAARLIRHEGDVCVSIHGGEVSITGGPAPAGVVTAVLRVSGVHV